MSERTSITQISQLGVEATKGQAATVTKRLGATSIEPAIQTEINTYKPVGNKFATMGALSKEWVEAAISGGASYNDIVYLLASALSYSAPAQQGATAAYKWTFAPAQSAEDTVKTFTVESGSSARAGKFTYGIVNELGLAFSRDSVEVSGTMLGQAYTDGATLTSSGVTQLDVQPILPTQVSVYMDTTAATLGNTKLTRAFSAEWTLSDRFGPLWPLDASLSGFAAAIETEPTGTLTLLVEADASGMGPLAAMRSGDKKFIRIKAVGPAIASPYTYELVLDMCGVVSEVGDFSDEDGVYAIEWTFTTAYDTTWTKALQVTVINTVTGL